MDECAGQRKILRAKINKEETADLGYNPGVRCLRI